MQQGARGGLALAAPTVGESALERSTAGMAIAVTSLGKRYGSVWALSDVALQVERGQVLVVFGPNGAGKTTLLRLLTTAARPSTGKGQILGHDLLTQGEAIRAKVALMSHHNFLYEDLTALENLHFVAALCRRKLPRSEALALLEHYSLGRWADRRVRTYSSGMKKRLALARVVVQSPELLYLDEPYAALDQQALDLV
ncbi:MAG: ABC transporter ATP-binding protein, partial [Deinococcus sp.]|nr:ABC transporter ATP-binding protein [Deinococcus sp.]